ncbi:MAG TPA: glycosyltransferase [Paludibacteraceae bacterium]|nr:glycosyltransferase [Paludibacteraceae bacterium]HQF50696.1 glycosyltransferase [Paludibacteraceae bacterium]HQJ89352.1 glycosyltransferase [Paludibacteraceae bacterium]
MANNNSILIIIVLYKKNLGESEGFSSYIEHEKRINCRHQLMIYNNSPEIEISKEDGDFIIINAKENGMLAKAYNEGLRIAQEKGFDWIMLIDQDTYLNAQYFEKVSSFLNNPNNSSGAVPLINANGTIVSPIQYKPMIGPHFFFHPITKEVCTNRCFAAFNSGSVLKVSDLVIIGGFNEGYPLDSLDNWYYHQLYKRGCSFNILDVNIIQNLSVADYSKMTISRYKSVMNYSLKFAISLGFLAFISWKLRNIGRCLIQIKDPNKRRFVPYTIQYLFKNWID